MPLTSPGRSISCAFARLGISSPTICLVGGLLVASVSCGGDRGGQRLPHLRVQVGPSPPAVSTALPRDVDVGVLQISLEAGGADVAVSAIRFHASGTGDDAADLEGARLYRDRNRDGVPDLLDVLLGSSAAYPGDDGVLSISGLYELIPTGSQVAWLLVYDIGPGADSGESFCATLLDGTDVEATVKGKAALVEVQGPAFGCVTIATISLAVSLGPASPPPRLVEKCGLGDVALQVGVAAGPTEDVIVNFLTFTASGTGSDDIDILEAKLFADNNADGLLDGGDTPLALPQGYSGDDGTVSFSGLNRTIPASSSEQWLLVYDRSPDIPAGLTFAAGVASNFDVGAWGVSSSGAVSVAGAPIVGGEITVWGPLLLSAVYEDANVDRLLNGGDTVTLLFDQEVVVSGIPPRADRVFDLEPQGSFGWAAVVVPGSTPRELEITILYGFDLVPNGSYGIDPGSTGVNLAIDQVRVTDCTGARVRPMPLPLDLGGSLEPFVSNVGCVDSNWSCTLDGGDRIDVTFSKTITLLTSDPSEAFQLPVSGDSLGAGASFLGGGMPRDVSGVTIVLGSGPILKSGGTFDPALLGAGSPSGLDVTATPGLVVEALYPSVSAAPGGPPGRDLPEPRVWTSVGEDQQGAGFGRSVASAGDVNGDGYHDVIVATYWNAFLYLGGPAGPSAIADWDYGIRGNGAAASAGDVNGDGYGDVIVGSRSAGRAYVFAGGTGGLPSNPTWELPGGGPASFSFGQSAAFAGDVDGDGFDDVVVGAPRFNTASSVYAGEAYLYRGGAGGLSNTSAWTALGVDQYNARFGSAVASAGDVNGDGFADVLVGEPLLDTAVRDEGRVYLYLGGPGGLSPTPAWTSSGDDQPLSEFGSSLASAGDTDGDGFEDVIIGAPGYTSGDLRGKAYLHLGGPAGLTSSPDWTSAGDGGAFASFGITVSSAGDLDDDGYSDVVIGAPGSDDLAFPISRWDAGKAYAYLGGPLGLSTTPAWESRGDHQEYSRFGSSVSGAGDVNQDGFPEVIVGAGRFSTENSRAGKIYVFCLTQ